MGNVEYKKDGVGVVVGRFQVHWLHSGHVEDSLQRIRDLAVLKTEEKFL